MAGLDDLLDDFYEKIKGKMSFTPNQKAEITGAGAEAYSKVLKKETPESDVDYGSKSVDVGKSGKKTSHLRDDISYKPGIVDSNLKTGDTDVGFDPKDDFLLRIINDGKKKMSPKEQANLHFIDRAQSKARDSIAKAMESKLIEVMKDD